MARGQKSRPEIDPVRNYLEGVAKQLVDRIYGPKGPAWGTKLTDIEAVLLDLRAVLTEEMLQQALQRQAAQPAAPAAEYQTCPKCGKQTQARLPDDDAKPRVLNTHAGMAQWHEPEQYCTRCRRAFFPSEQEPGD
jgi:NADH pyrophosphatase NudC (nudix superfamily)